MFCEEISEFDESDLKQIRKRLRGRKGQKIVALFNPISEDHWIKKKIFDTETLTEVDNHLYGKLKDSVTGKTAKGIFRGREEMGQFRADHIQPKKKDLRDAPPGYGYHQVHLS